MDERSQERFDKLVAPDVDISGFTQADIDFLKARRSYLTGEQAERFEKVFKAGVKEASKEEAPKEEPEEEEKAPEVEKKPKEKKKISLDELKKRGEAVGLKYQIGTKKVYFEKAIIKAEKKGKK